MKRPASKPNRQASFRPAQPAAKATATVPKPAAVTNLRDEKRRLQDRRKLASQTAGNERKKIRSEIKRFTVASRRRRTITFISFGSVLSLLGLLMATWLTPMLAIEKIEISGLSRLKEKTVLNAVASLKGTPLTLLDENSVAQRLGSFALIESFSVVSNPPHTLEIHIVERQPIAIVAVGSTNYLYDPAGVQIGVAKSSDKYPIVEIDADPATSEKYQLAIEVMLALPVELSGEVATVKATSQASVSLTLRGKVSRSVIWGDASSSILKSKVLAALIATTKTGRSVVFDVSSPDAPTVRYLNY